jgi:hypothetical protein
VIRIVLAYDPDWQALRWAKENCSSYITNTATEDTKICYYFREERDATAFVLRWS